MNENYKELKQFVYNFFSLKKYLQPNNDPLNDDEIEALVTRPEKYRKNRQLIDRLLDDGEAVEIIADFQVTAEKTASSPRSSNVISLAEVRKKRPSARPIKFSANRDLKKVAASPNMPSFEEQEAFRFKDEHIEGFIQMIAYKQNQFIVSGHFKLVDPQASIRLILPDGHLVETFEREGDLLRFRAVVAGKISLSSICYELY